MTKSERELKELKAKVDKYNWWLEKLRDYHWDKWCEGNDPKAKIRFETITSIMTLSPEHGGEKNYDIL